MTGTLALVGGNEFGRDCRPMDRKLLRLLGKHPRVAILPTAAAGSNPRKAAKNGVRHFLALDARAEAIMIVDEQTANKPEMVGQLSDFDMVYMAGGSPPHLMESLRGSAALDAMRDLLARGGMLAGSSAGAMAMGERMWGFEDGWLEGWGLAPAIAIIPHHASFAARWGADRMQSSLPSDITLLGIDEATAAFGDGKSEWQVVGPGEVTVYTADAGE